MIDERVQRPKDLVADVVLAQVIPEVFDGVKFWAVGRERQQVDGGGNLQSRGGVPSSSIRQCSLGKQAAVCARKRDMVSVSTQGRISEQSCPSRGLTAAKP